MELTHKMHNLGGSNWSILELVGSNKLVEPAVVNSRLVDTFLFIVDQIYVGQTVVNRKTKKIAHFC